MIANILGKMFHNSLDYVKDVLSIRTQFKN